MITEVMGEVSPRGGSRDDFRRLNFLAYLDGRFLGLGTPFLLGAYLVYFVTYV